MTPSMRLSDIVRKWRLTLDRSAFEAIKPDIGEVFALGHEFGIERAAQFLEENKGLAGVAAARRIRALRIERVKPVATRDDSFLSDGSK